MKDFCERCKQPLRRDFDARVCSYDCTFCSDCAQAMDGRCPNCGGTLMAAAGTT